jgi:hypothetical protein
MEMSAESYDEMSILASQIPTKLLNLYTKKVTSQKGEQKYEESIRIFCISLQWKSASAYRHIRDCLEMHFPVREL